MYRSYDYHSSSSSSRYYSASSDEYLDRLDRIQRMPSMIADTPYFPNMREVLNNQNVHVEEINNDQNKKKKSDKIKKSGKKNHQKNTDGHKKVHFAENEKKNEVSRDGKADIRDEKSIDAEADGFIKQKHRGFALCKWDTFKVY